jgi:Cu(I)/Ag(I) efflux system membrane protein CusA/SilA
MWSTRVGSEVMKPLATPVLGGMVSSLLHVLVVTPVVFFWLHERRLGLHQEVFPTPSRPRAVPWKPVAAVTVIIAAAMATSLWRHAKETGGANAPVGQVVQHVNAGGVEISLLSPSGTLHQGRNVFTIEFRSIDGRLVDAGNVRVSGNMPMPGMVMSSGLRVQRTEVMGRYQASAEFGMAGAWHMAIEWDGPVGKGLVNFEGAVQ